MLPNHITDLFLMHFLLLKSCLLYFLNVSIVKVMVSVIESSGHSEEYKRKSNISLSSFPTTDPTVKVCASFQRCTYVICKCTYIMFMYLYHYIYMYIYIQDLKKINEMLYILLCALFFPQH